MAKLLKLFGHSLQRAMKEHNFSKAALHKSTKISRTAIDAFLEGEGNPTLETVEKIAGALGINPIDLLIDPSARPLVEDDYKRAVSEWGKALAKRHRTVDGVLLALIEGLREVLEESQAKKPEE